MLRIPTSILTPKSVAISCNAGETIEVPKLATRIARDTVSVMYLLIRITSVFWFYHFFHFGQFRGFSESLSPSQSISLGASPSLDSILPSMGTWVSGTDVFSDFISEDVGSLRVEAAEERDNVSNFSVFWGSILKLNWGLFNVEIPLERLWRCYIHFGLPFWIIHSQSHLIDNNRHISNPQAHNTINNIADE